MFNFSKSVVFMTLALLSGCSNQIRDDNWVLDLDWKSDVHNIIISSVSDVDNLRYWVRQEPEYYDGYPHQLACVEISQPSHGNAFFKVNLNTYGFVQVINCNSNYWEYGHLVENGSQGNSGLLLWDYERIRQSNQNYPVSMNIGIDGVDAYMSAYGEFRLIFSDLFEVNEYKLSHKGKNILLSLIDDVKYLPIDTVTVYGVADSSGFYKNNTILADKRAHTVKQFLVEEGMNFLAIDVRGTVENGLATSRERVTQRRFIVEITLKK